MYVHPTTRSASSFGLQKMIARDATGTKLTDRQAVLLGPPAERDDDAG